SKHLFVRIRSVISVWNHQNKCFSLQRFSIFFFSSYRRVRVFVLSSHTRPVVSRPSSRLTLILSSHIHPLVSHPSSRLTLILSSHSHPLVSHPSSRLTLILSSHSRPLISHPSSSGEHTSV